MRNDGVRPENRQRVAHVSRFLNRASARYVLYFFAALLATSILLGYFLWKTHEQTVEIVEANMRNEVATVEASVDGTLRRIHASLDHIAARLPPEALVQRNKGKFAGPVSRDLNILIGYFPELHSLRVFDANGDDLYYSGKMPMQLNVAERSYFQSARTNPQQPLHFSETLLEKATQRQVIVIAKPLTDDKGRFLGVAVGAMELDFLSRLFSTLDLGESGAIALRQKDDGALLVRWPPLPEAINVPAKPDHPLQLMIRSGVRQATHKMQGHSDGIDRIYCFRVLENYPIVVFAGRGSDDYLSQWRQTAWLSICFSLLALLVLALFLIHHARAHSRELRVTQQLAEARDAAEAANRAKTTFLANMSHELRTPLNAIMGLTELARREAATPKLQERLGKVTMAAKHLLGLISDVLDIAKIEAERLTLEKQVFVLADILDNVLTLNGFKANEKGLKLQLDILPELKRRVVRGDPLRLTQILLNLTSNAVKFTAQGEVRLCVRLQEERADAVQLHFVVSDTGIGIAASDQGCLFVPFEQVDASMTRKYGGTGLGLAICRRLVNLMGGEIAVESQLGQGSRFWFTVWLDKADDEVLNDVGGSENAGLAAFMPAKHAAARILLADDDPESLDLTRTLLESAGWGVTTAEDGVQAVNQAQAAAYDLILLDMQMPRMNGLAAAQAIRALPGYAQTPILALTANAFAEDRLRCLEAGMNDHLAKPLQADNLFAALQQWLGEKRA